MKSWKVLEKYEKRVDRESVELHLKVERNGQERDAIVSGATWYPATVGGSIELSAHSGTSEAQVTALALALRRVLVRAGAIREEQSFDVASLLVEADKYAGSPKPAVVGMRAETPEG